MWDGGTIQLLLEKKMIDEKLKCAFLESEDHNVIYVSFNFGSGYGDRLVSEDGTLLWVGSGSSNILVNLKRKKIKEKFPELEVSSRVGMDTANISMGIHKDQFKDMIHQIIKIVFSDDISVNEFKAHKETSSLMFNNHKKNVYFRSNMEIQEFASPNRLFKIDLISQDLSEVKLDDIMILNRTLFRQENTVMVVSGDINSPRIRNELQEHVLSIQFEERPEKTVNHIYRRGVSEDNIITKPNFGESYSIGTVTFRNKPIDYSLEEEEVYVQIIGRIVFGENHTINVGADYANIIYQRQEDTHFKNKILSTFWSKMKFDIHKRKLNEQLNNLKENDTEKFSIILGLYAVKDMDFIRLIQLSKTASYERFISYINDVKKSMTETKIVYLKEGGAKSKWDEKY